jgi:hypothetical protein
MINVYLKEIAHGKHYGIYQNDSSSYWKEVRCKGTS